MHLKSGGGKLDMPAQGKGRRRQFFNDIFLDRRCRKGTYDMSFAFNLSLLQRGRGRQHTLCTLHVLNVYVRYVPRLYSRGRQASVAVISRAVRQYIPPLPRCLLTNMWYGAVVSSLGAGGECSGGGRQQRRNRMSPTFSCSS